MRSWKPEEVVCDYEHIISGPLLEQSIGAVVVSQELHESRFSGAGLSGNPEYTVAIIFQPTPELRSHGTPFRLVQSRIFEAVRCLTTTFFKQPFKGVSFRVRHIQASSSHLWIMEALEYRLQYLLILSRAEVVAVAQMRAPTITDMDIAVDVGWDGLVRHVSASGGAVWRE